MKKLTALLSAALLAMAGAAFAQNDLSAAHRDYLSAGGQGSCAGQRRDLGRDGLKHGVIPNHRKREVAAEPTASAAKYAVAAGSAVSNRCTSGLSQICF